MYDEVTCKPQLRLLETFAVPAEHGGETTIGLRDPSGLSDVVLTLSPAALFLMALMDGTRDYAAIRAEFHATHGHDVPRDTFVRVVDQLEQAMFLEGPGFEAHYEQLQAAYRAAAVRPMPHAGSMGLDAQGSIFRKILAQHAPLPKARPVRGVIAPHLDYGRGAACYAWSYGALQNLPAPRRVVVLGTNHFGRSASVVATVQSFETPLGVSACDVEFLGRIEERCGDLRRFEFDHAREHSVELQVGWLQYLFGAEAFRMVAVLCPDPCGPTRTAPHNGVSVDLRTFAHALGDLLRTDGEDTLLVAGADLSHVGAAFGDDRALDDSFLSEVAAHNRSALAALERGDPEAFLDEHAAIGNPTRVCSVGCLYALATALYPVRCTLLKYHQAVDQASQTGVTCAAAVYPAGDGP